jgi:hypothetical protein
LKRCNRSRGFSAKFARYKENCRNYRIFWGLNCKSLGNRLPWWPTPTVGWIPSDSRHGRPRGAGEKKEDDEGIRFYTLLVAEMRRGGRNRWRKERWRFCPASVPDQRCWAGAAYRGEVAAAGGGRGCRGKAAAVGTRAGGGRVEARRGSHMRRGARGGGACGGGAWAQEKPWPEGGVEQVADAGLREQAWAAALAA